MTGHPQSLDSSFNQAQHPNVTFALQAAEVGTWDLDITHQRVWWDARCKELFGFQWDDVVPYEQVLSYMHPDDQSRVNAAVQWALNPQSEGRYDIQYRTVGATDSQLRWLHCRGRAFFTDQHVAYRFSGIAQDITELVNTRQQLGNSEARFADLINATPAATAIFTGRDMCIQQVNAPMLAIWGKDASVIGKTLHVALPELEGQPFLDQLQQVFDTGESFRHTESVAEVIEQGKRKRVWFNHEYKPLYNQEGHIYGVINTASDVTQQVIIRQTLVEKEAVLSGAVNLAELGTWTLDVASGATHLSPRHAAMFGLETTELDYETALAIVHPNDRARVRAAFEAALQPGSDGRYQAEYRIINTTSGQQQVIRARGETSLDAKGRPLHITGTTQDVTLERELQSSLEQQVQQRTKELASVNRELLTNNEALAEANSLLVRSNENLQTFAYVASHDLQEPLRKIQQFGDLLKTRLADSIGPEELTYLERMQLAASRMSTLVKDLLGYSRIATQRSTDEPVALNQVIETILGVLDLAIAEAGAQVQVDALPIIAGDATQLGQLFQNLISNALKFRRSGVFPQIRISSQTVAADELLLSVKPTRRTAYYHQIDVADNGIGFDEKYLDRIFQVFQRLHGRTQYAGTGVGLAICEKVVTNHGGIITATSQPDQGATFSIYLPAIC